MGAFVRTTSLWDTDYGLRPTGFVTEKDRYGEFEGRATYLGLCPCGNCPRLVAIYADDELVCRKQSAGLDRQLQELLAQFMKLRDRRIRIQQRRHDLEEIFFPEESTLEEYWEVTDEYEEAWLEEAVILQLLASSGLLDLNQAEVKIFEHITEDLCPFFAILRNEDMLSRPALMSGEVATTEEMESEAEMPFGPDQLVEDPNVFLDDALGMDDVSFELLDRLFNSENYTDDDLES